MSKVGQATSSHKDYIVPHVVRCGPLLQATLATPPYRGVASVV
jgi:hypothetical protein